MQLYETVSVAQLQDAQEGFACRFLANYRQLDDQSLMVVAERGDSAVLIGLDCIELDALHFGRLYEWMGIVRRPSQLQQEDKNWPPVYVQANICRDASGLSEQLHAEVSALKAAFLSRCQPES